MNVKWPGRLEKLSLDPIIYFDVAHNDESIIAVCKYLEKNYPDISKILLLSIQKTKQLNLCINYIEKLFSKVFITQLNEKMYEAVEFKKNIFPRHQR